MLSATAQIIIAVIGSSAFFTFIQFLIQRRDNKKNQIEEIKEEFHKGLDEREETGKARYTEHQESIAKLNEAIMKLTENDTQMKKYMRYVGDEIMGLAHDKLVYLTNKYQARGAITLKEKATLEAIYVPYHEGLGGNGDGEQGYLYAMQLPVISDEEALKRDIAIKQKKWGIIDD